MDHVRRARDLPTRLRRELEEFFVQVTALDDKDVRVLGWAGRVAALELIRRSRME
jgi:inorganic pyrophosphatase